MLKENAHNNITGEFASFLKNIWGEKKPLCKLFKTDLNYYLFDTCTNKLIKCNELEYICLNYLLSMDIDSAILKLSSSFSTHEITKQFNEIHRMIEDENILRIIEADLGIGKHFSNLDYQLKNELGYIQLEVTERCNLRCSYCIYNSFFTEKRDHGRRDMTPDIAFRTIDYSEKHSRQTDDFAITFYGGEPLLNISLIKSAVEYAKKRFSRKLSYSITTNGTLINQSTAEFLYENNFSVVISLDGPKDIHDKWRKNAHNKGSFDRTITGLTHIYNVYKNDINRIALSMVYTPPYSENKVNRIAEIWDKIPWLSQKMRVVVTYPSFGSIVNHISYKSDGPDSSLYNWSKKNFLNSFKTKKDAHPIARCVIERRLARLSQRIIFDIPKRFFFLNGCCVPGVRKLYVSVDGKLSVCERMNHSPYIGDIYNGINYDLIRKCYIDEYKNKSVKKCSHCWAVSICGICYMHAFRNYEIDMVQKDMYCYLERNEQLKYLVYLCTLLEINENGLDYLYDWKIT